jgi:hypothetical protein
MNKLMIVFTIFFVLNVMPTGQAGKYFTCTDDCEPAQSGYNLIGCTTIVNNTVEHDEGNHIPSGSTDGYVYVAAHTESGYDEIIACEYWKEDKPLPPTDEQVLGEHLERDRISSNIKDYNQNIKILPDFLVSLFANEKLYIHVNNVDGSKSEYASITEKGLIIEGTTWLDNDNDGVHDIWQENGIKPTVDVYIDEKALEEIKTSADPFDRFEQAWGNEIKYKGFTLGTKVKTFAMDAGVKLYSIFT